MGNPPRPYKVHIFLLLSATIAYSALFTELDPSHFGLWPEVVQRSENGCKTMNQTLPSNQTTATLVESVYGTNINVTPFYQSFAYNDLYYIPTNTYLDDVYQGILFQHRKHIVHYSSYRLFHPPAINKMHLEESLQ